MGQNSTDYLIVLNCDDHADKHNVDRERALVWHAFSQLFLDCNWSDEELSCIGDQISKTRFSLQELSFILTDEVWPVCAANKLMLFGGEGALGFEIDWLIRQCSDRHKKNSYRLPSDSNLNDLPWTLHIKAPLFFESYLMLCRVKRIRSASS
ncbi:MAG: hypothetical protein EKK48_10325 [Candidatus Melainabacteria bacterium]|nr:MAG: hypothetical protein EKK48_10325 [Candidatus Melainabacteria bacterium]